MSLHQPIAAPATAQSSHLAELEAESIHIMREVAAQFGKPAMLYSIDKDSSVMLHLAQKAFWPGKPPFPLLHVDTTWKFKEMIAFRDRRAAELGLDLIVHINQEGVRAGIGPFTHGSAVHTDVMKTVALKQALDQHGFDAALGGARRDGEKSRSKERIFSFHTAAHRWDPKNQRPSCGSSTTGASARARASVSSSCRIGPSLTSGNTSPPRISWWCRSISPRSARWWCATAR